MRGNIITTGGTIDKVEVDAKSESGVGSHRIAGKLREVHLPFEFRVGSVPHLDSLEQTDDDRHRAKT